MPDKETDENGEKRCQMRKDPKANNLLGLSSSDQGQTQHDTDQGERGHELQQFLCPPRPDMLDGHTYTQRDQLGGQEDLDDFPGVDF